MHTLLRFSVCALLLGVAHVVAFRTFTTHPHRGTYNDMVWWQKQKTPEKFASEQDAPEQWLTQPLDHFDPLNSKYWQQRYFVNDTFWDGSGPVFVLLGGEGPVSADAVSTHFIVSSYAAIFSALVVAPEHRFYGKSVPTGDLTITSLKYLTSQQALADYALFVEFINDKYSIQTPQWISFGGSYSGSLSAWFRLKYPHLIAGSIATSAPVLAQLDFPEYNEVVQQSLTYFSGPQCARSVAAATQQIETLLQTTAGTQQVEATFQTCSPIQTANDVALFFSNLEGGIAEVVQYNNDNNKYTPMSITALCSVLTSGGSDVLSGYASFNQQFNTFSGTNCTQVNYNAYIKELQDTRPYPENDNAAGRSWTYQTCTEFGFFQTGSSSQQPFSSKISLQWYQQQCADIFGIVSSQQTPMPNIDWTNAYYGATNLQSSNIILPNGNIDPWHILGVKYPPNEFEYVTLINGTAHCADLYPPRSSDVSGLTQTRALEVKLIQQWLSANPK